MGRWAVVVTGETGSATTIWSWLYLSEKNGRHKAIIPLSGLNLMPLPTFRDLRAGVTQIYNLWPLITRLVFTFVFWSGTFACIRFGAMLHSPVLDQPLKDLGNLVNEQVNLWVIGTQALVLVIIMGLLAFLIERLAIFRQILREEAFRLYYNATLSGAGYSLVFGL